MSRRNGQRARFHVNRKRKLLKRVRMRAVAASAKATDKSQA